MNIEENSSRTQSGFLREMLRRIVTAGTKREVVPIDTPATRLVYPCAYVTVFEDEDESRLGKYVETTTTRFRVGILYQAPKDRLDALEEIGDVEKHNLTQTLKTYRLTEQDRLTTDALTVIVTGITVKRRWCAAVERQDQGWAICDGTIESTIEYKR